MNQEELDKVKIEIDTANNQRRIWLFFSSLIFIVVLAYIIGWHWVHELNNPWLEWSLISIGLVITVNWWYWTMSVIKRNLYHQNNIVSILEEIVSNVKEVKQNIQNLVDEKVDKSK
jgi:biotin transporter BioY